MSIGETGPDSGARLLSWGLRTYALLLVLCVVAGTVAAPWLLRTRADVVYEAQALVVVQTTELPLAALNAYSEEVFGSGAVARRVAAELDIPGDPDRLIPTRLSVVVGQDSTAMPVVGRGSDPTAAAQLADAGARAYVAELNSPGPALGVFVWHSAAQLPQRPVESGLGAGPAAGIGAVAGAALGLGVVALLLSARRPVVEPARFASLAGAPVLGVVTLPARSKVAPDPRLVPGLAPLVRRLAVLPPGRVHVVSPPGDAARRGVVAELLATALLRWRPTVLTSSGEREYLPPPTGGPGAEEPLVVVDVAGVSAADPESTQASTLLVLREGTPQGRVLRISAEYVDADIRGLILVRKGRLSRPVRRSPTASESPRPSRPAEAAIGRN